MAVPYYDLAKVKLDLEIPDTANDVQLAHWNDEAEAEIDDILFIKASKVKNLNRLPPLPFPVGSIPETVQGAADHLVKSRYYAFVKDLDMSRYHIDQADAKLVQYIARLSIDSRIYTRIVR